MRPLHQTEEHLVRFFKVKFSYMEEAVQMCIRDRVTAAVLKAAAPNQIILLHDIYPTSVDAALAVVDALQGEGYRFVTVAELLEANGIQPEAGVLYCSGDP